MRTINVVLIFILLSSMSVFASEKKPETRTPANSGSCIKVPTLTCIPGYHVKQIKGCFKCVHSSVEGTDNIYSANCLPHTVTCAHGFIPTQDSNGCYHCAQKAVIEPSCIHSPTLECVSGYHTSEDENGCFHCVK